MNMKGEQLSFPLPEFISEAYVARKQVEEYLAWEEWCARRNLSYVVKRPSIATFAKAYGFDLDAMLEDIKSEKIL